MLEIANDGTLLKAHWPGIEAVAERFAEGVRDPIVVLCVVAVAVRDSERKQVRELLQKVAAGKRPRVKVEPTLPPPKPLPKKRKRKPKA